MRRRRRAMPEWVANVSLVLAVALSAFNLWDKIDAKKKALKEPTKAMENRIAVLERTVNYEMVERFKQYDSHFDRDLRRLESIEEGNRVTQKVLLALVSHALDGNDIEGLKDAKKDMEQYLINR
jgi:hypothetical protein